MKGPDGKPVEATGKVVLDYFTAADLSDPTMVVLTMADGTVVRLPRTREHFPSIEFSYQNQLVQPSTQYRFHVLLFVKDTLSSKEVLTTYAAYQQASELKIDAIAVDEGGYVENVVNVSITPTPIAAGVEYNLIYDIRFTTGDGASWNPAHKFRIAIFLTWKSHSMMTVAEFDRKIPTTDLKMGPTTLTLTVGATYQLEHSFRPANSTDKTVWSSSDETIATVSDTGLVTAVAPGTCTITIQKGTFSKNCECTVEAATP